MRLNLFGAVALGALLAGLAEPALAAETAAASTDAGPAAEAIEEVVVTARRREEALTDVPVAVTALSGQQLRAANVTSLQEIGRIAPSLRVSPVVGRVDTVAFTIRGMTETSGSITSDPSVGVYFADAIQPRAQGLGRALFDIASVQVLKGPQGTLFGKNLTGGAILIEPKAPVIGETGGYVQATYGNFDRREVQGAVNVPISDKVALRLGLNLARRDGYYTNLTTGSDLRNEHADAFRVSLLVAPTDSFLNLLIVDAYKGHARGGAFVPVAVNPAVNVPGADPVALRLAALQRQQARSIYDVEENQDSPMKSSNYGITNTSTFETGGLTFKNIFNHRQVTSRDVNEDGMPLQLVQVSTQVKSMQYSNEIQVLGSAFDNQLEYIAGGYHFWERGKGVARVDSLGVRGQVNQTQATNETRSVFVQADYHFTPKLTLTAGGRYTWDDREFDLLATLPTGVVSVDADRQKKFSKPTYTLSLNYKPADDTLLYVTTRRGYRSGGFNGGANTLAQLTQIEPEVLTDYEFGAKSEGSVGSVGYRATLAVFHSKYDDIQRNLVALIGTPPQPTRVLLNAAKAKVNGGEFEATIVPVDALSLIGFVGYTDAKYKEFIDPTNGANLSGLPFAQTPKWTYRIAAHVKLPSPDAKGGRLGVSADYYHTSKILITDAAILPGYVQPGYGVVGARLSYDNIAGTGLRAAVFGNNLAGKEYTLAGTPLYGAPFGVTSIVFGNPRTYGIEIGYEF